MALKKAKAAVARCCARYNRAKVLVQDTAEAECAALLLEDSPWNEMFHRLVKYRDDAGDCNVKQNFGAEDSKDSPDMVRRLSAWVGKNRKDGKKMMKWTRDAAMQRWQKGKYFVIENPKSAESWKKNETTMVTLLLY